MIAHLNTEEQRKKWLNISRNFVKKDIFILLVVILYFCVHFSINYLFIFFILNIKNDFINNLNIIHIPEIDIIIPIRH